MSARSRGTTGPQVPHHQLRHRGSGFGCSDHGSWVNFAPICHPSVSAELPLPPAFQGPLPFVVAPISSDSHLR